MGLQWFRNVVEGSDPFPDVPKCSEASLGVLVSTVRL